MRYPSLDQFIVAEKASLAKGPVAMILAEDNVEVDTTLRHHLDIGFAPVILLAAPELELSAELEAKIARVDTQVFETGILQRMVNALIAAAPSTWLFYCYNAEYLFFPFLEQRKVGDMLAFHTEERREAWQTYCDGLQSLAQAGRLSMQKIHGERTNNYHCFYILLPSNAERESLRVHLQRQGISAYTHYVPLHSSPMGLQLGYRAEDLPRTEDLANRLLRLPMWAGLPQEQARHVVDQIHAWAAL